jgi:hypothetical protein
MPDQPQQDGGHDKKNQVDGGRYAVPEGGQSFRMKVDHLIQGHKEYRDDWSGALPGQGGRGYPKQTMQLLGPVVPFPDFLWTGRLRARHFDPERSILAQQFLNLGTPRLGQRFGPKIGGAYRIGFFNNQLSSLFKTARGHRIGEPQQECQKRQDSADNERNISPFDAVWATF